MRARARDVGSALVPFAARCGWDAGQGHVPHVTHAPHFCSPRSSRLGSCGREPVRPRRRQCAARGAALGREAGRRAVHRRRDARRRTPHRRLAQRGRHAGDRRRPRRGDTPGRTRHGTRPRISRRPRCDRVRPVRDAKHLDQAHRFGLKLDPGLCRSLVGRARRRRGRAQDLRSHRYGGLEHDGRDARALPVASRRGPRRCRIVLQATLRRTEADVEALRAVRPSVRLCRASTAESASHRVPGVRRCSARASSAASTDCSRPAAASAIETHDEWLIGRALELPVDGLDPSDYELQMLLGVRADRAREPSPPASATRLRAYGHQW